MSDETRRPRREGAGSTLPELEGGSIVTCSEDFCERVSRARGLCEMHYARLKRAGLGELQRSKPKKPDGVRLQAQKGENRCCVDCGDVPLFGGMRCLRHFQAKAWQRRGLHGCMQHGPSVTCYSTCRCRCGDCRDAANAARKDLRRRNREVAA